MLPVNEFPMDPQLPERALEGSLFRPKETIDLSQGIEPATTRLTTSKLDAIGRE